MRSVARRGPMLGGAGLVALAGRGHAGSFPSRPLRMVVPFAPGGASAFNDIAVPAATPAEVVGRLNREINAVLAEEGFRRRLAESGLEPIGGRPEEAAATVREEQARWREVILAAGIRIE